MKKAILPLILFVGMLTAPLNLQAQQSSIGVGAIVGSPNGLSAKAWIGDNIAVDGALSFTLGENTSTFYLHSDVLLHTDLSNEGFEVERGNLYLHYGAGVQLRWFELTDQVETAVRAPVGVSYNFEQSPADIFYELVPTIEIDPFFRFGFGGAIGIRYYLGE